MGLLPSGFWEIWDSYVQWSLDLGLPGLGILSFTEAFVQPIPPEALTLPMFIDASGNPGAIFLIWATDGTNGSPRGNEKLHNSMN